MTVYTNWNKKPRQPFSKHDLRPMTSLYAYDKNTRLYVVYECNISILVSFWKCRRIYSRVLIIATNCVNHGKKIQGKEIHKSFSKQYSFSNTGANLHRSSSATWASESYAAINVSTIALYSDHRWSTDGCACLVRFSVAYLDLLRILPVTWKADRQVLLTHTRQVATSNAVIFTHFVSDTNVRALSA